MVHIESMSIISDNGLPMWCIVSINSFALQWPVVHCRHYTETKTKKALLECFASGP